MAQETKLTPHFTPASSANAAPQASPRVTENGGPVEALLAESGKGAWGTVGVGVWGWWAGREGGGLSWLRFMSEFSSTSSSRCLLLDRLPHVTLFFAVLIERLLVNVFHDKTFPLLPVILLPFIMWTLRRGWPVGHSGNKYYMNSPGSCWKKQSRDGYSKMWPDVQCLGRRFDTHFLRFHIRLSDCVGSAYVCFISIIIKCLVYRCSKHLRTAKWCFCLNKKLSFITSVRIRTLPWSFISFIIAFQDKPSLLLCWPVFSTDGGNGQINSVQDAHLRSPLQQTVCILDQPI